MSKKRPTYSIEFKKEAASLVVDQKYSISEACTAMGVGKTAMRNWVRQLELERPGATPQSKALTTEQQTIQKLQARIKQIEWENSILKKATALLITGGIKSSI